VDQRDLNSGFTKYFKGIIGSKCFRRIKANWDDPYPPASRVDLSDLDIPFSESEIWNAISNMPSDKEPRSDGFPILFYKEFWHILKQDLICMFNEFFFGRLQLGRFNFASIFLLHKKVGTSELKDFHPISLINCSIKIISKVLANRLNSKMDSLVDCSQTAFIKGRNITDGVAIV